MKTLGIIGGTSYHSTLYYYKEINRIVSEQIGNSQNPELIIYSINIDVMRRQVGDEINQKYLEVAQKLENAGAEAIIIAANTPHMAVDYVQPRINIPFLHIGDATAHKAKNINAQKLLLLGNKPTMIKRFLKEYLSQQHHLEILIPNTEAIEKSHYYVSKELTRGIFSVEAKGFYKQLISEHKTNIDAVVLGCTELPILLQNENLTVPTLSTTDLHIQSASNFILDN